MVDKRRVQRLLAGIAADLAFLSGFSERGGADVARDEVAVRSIKYTFITAIEGCARIAHHLVASGDWGVPDTNADAIRLLAAHGVLPRPLADSLAAAVGFRNLLVHQYADVDDRRAVEHLTRIVDLQEFIEAVERWLRSQA